MNQPGDNPYSPPVADIQPEAAQEDAFDQFPRFSEWWVLALTILTLTLYWYYWYFTRTNVINRVMPERQISSMFVWTTLGLAAANILIDFLPRDFFMISNLHSLGIYDVIYNVLDLTTILLAIVWAFLIRDRINALSGARKTSALWVNGVLTFLAGAVYLAYKINQIRDSRGDAA